MSLMHEGTPQEVIAAAIANARGGRRGMPPIDHVLRLLPANLRREVMEDACAVIDALAAAGLADLRGGTGRGRLGR